MGQDNKDCGIDPEVVKQQQALLMPEFAYTAIDWSLIDTEKPQLFPPGAATHDPHHAEINKVAIVSGIRPEMLKVLTLTEDRVPTIMLPGRTQGKSISISNPYLPYELPEAHNKFMRNWMALAIKEAELREPFLGVNIKLIKTATTYHKPVVLKRFGSMRNKKRLFKAVKETIVVELIECRNCYPAGISNMQEAAMGKASFEVNFESAEPLATIKPK